MRGVVRVVAVAALLGLVAAGCVPGPPGPVLSPGFLMRPERDAGFLSLPWPNDVRKSSVGTLDLSGLPGTEADPFRLLTGGLPLASLAFGEVVSRAGASVTGFGVNSGVFFRSTVAVDPTGLPDPVTSTSVSSPVQLIDLASGERAPVLVEFRPAGNRFRPDNSLVVLPYPGHPLRSNARYAAVLLDGLRAADGSALSPAPLIADLDSTWSPERGGTADAWSALREQRDATRSALTASGVDPAGLLAFTVFTTQDVHAEMDAVAATVAELPVPAIQVSSTSPCAADGRAGGAPTARVRGTVDLPRFQEGGYPFLLSGGAVDIRGGRAVVQGTDPVPVSISVPCGSAPVGGWPAVGFVSGTGASGDIDLSLHPFSFAGRVVAEIPPLYAGVRVGDLPPLEQVLVRAIGVDGNVLGGLLFFNLLNPASARTNVFQQAAQQLMLLRTLRSFATDVTGETATVDPTKVSASGHSQGAQTLPLVAAHDPQLAAVVSSSGSGGYYHQVAHAADKRGVIAQLTGDAPLINELTPLAQALQTTLEAADPANYPSTVDYLNIAGRVDGCVSVESSRHFAQATGLATANLRPPESLYGTPALDPPIVALPASANAAGRTRVNLETSGDHFVALFDPGPGTAFLDAVDAGTTPVVRPDAFPAPSLLPGCRGRIDEPPVRYGE